MARVLKLLFQSVHGYLHWTTQSAQPRQEGGLQRRVPGTVSGCDDPLKVALADVSRAHFYADSQREVYVELPAEAGGGYARLVRTFYGTRDAPALWEAFLASADGAEFELAPPEHFGAPFDDGYLRLSPARHGCDGFFGAALVRSEGGWTRRGRRTAGASC